MVKKLSSLNIKDKIKFGKHQVNNENPQEIIWRIAAKNHECTPAYPTNSVTLHTDRIIDYRALDALEPDNPHQHRPTKGNNRYLYSNMHQWLNSSASPGNWFSKQHEYDVPPDTSASVSNTDSQYAQQAGFLFHFGEKEIASILDTTIRVVKNIAQDGGGYDDMQAKVFIPSMTEISGMLENEIAEGAHWEAYANVSDRISYVTEQCLSNSLALYKVNSVTVPEVYFLRTPVATSPASQQSIDFGGALSLTVCAMGCIGIRPALNISGDTLVSGEPDEDGCYTVVFDDPPEIAATPPGDLGAQSTPFKQTYTISDPDADMLTVTEYLNDSVVRTLTGQQTGTKLTFDLTSQWQTLDVGTPYTAAIEVSDGILTTTHEWTFTRSNTAPTITTDRVGEIGKLAVPLKQEYIVEDANMDSLTVVEKLDGETLRTLPNQPSGTQLTFDLTSQWPTLSKDTSHTAVIEITDGLETVIHTWTFNVIDPIEQQLTANQSTIQPTGLAIPILPIQVLVSNNANDAEPIWEDASEAYLKRKLYNFENKTKTADEWCVKIKYIANGITIPVTLTTAHEINLS